MAHLFDLIVALLLFQGVLPSWSSIQFRLWNFQLGKNSCKEKPPQPSLTGKFWSTPLYELKNIQCFQVAYNTGFLIYVSEKCTISVLSPWFLKMTSLKMKSFIND